MKKYDFIVIGGGMAGMPVANKLAYKGFTTALIEKDLLGGTCLNRGCVPTKTMLYSAKVAQIVKNSERFGVISEQPKIDFLAIVKRKNDLIEKIRSGAYKQVKKNENLDLIEGEAKFVSKSIIKVSDLEYEASNFIINTGAIPNIPQIQGLETINYLTNDEILNLKELPKSLAILGGGYIAVEFAQMFSRFGTNVHIIQRSSRLINREDEEISEELLKDLNLKTLKFT